MKIIIPDPIDISDTSRQQLQGVGAVFYDELPPDSAVLIERIKDAELITANYVDITPEVIDGVLRLKYIVVPAVGYEWIDVAYAAKRGIKVLNCPSFNSQAVAEHALTLLMAVNRQLGAAAESLKEGKWEHDPFTGLELRGKKLGLIGHGNIGKRIEKLVAGFEMQVVFTDSKSSSEDIDTLLATADVICICAPLNTHTKHMINSRRLALCKKDAVLVNVGRGAIIEQAALYQALETHAIRGAGLDVFDGEPLTGPPSAAIVDLARLPNVVATPHIAYNTQETAERLGQQLFDDIQSCLGGAPINVVN